MAYTMQQVLDRARVPLNDAAKDRYTDAVLLGYAIDGLTMATTKRPDLLLGVSWAPTYSTLVVGSTFPLGDRYFSVVADYATARAEMADDENVDSNRAAALGMLFEQRLVGP